MMADKVLSHYIFFGWKILNIFSHACFFCANLIESQHSAIENRKSAICKIPFLAQKLGSQTSHHKI